MLSRAPRRSPPTPRTIQYVALLRGINVGGSNPIRMAALKECFEQQGFRNVTTYIQSGNVLFQCPESASALVPRIESALARTFGYSACVVLRALIQMHKIVSEAPAGFGQCPDTYRYDVIFLKAPLTASTALGSIRAREGVDQAHAGHGVVYFSRLISKASQSQLSRIVSLPIYQLMTIRNWNTTTALLRMMKAA